MGYLQKEGIRPNPETPKTILDLLQASHQNRRVAKIKDLQGPSPNNISEIKHQQYIWDR